VSALDRRTISARALAWAVVAAVLVLGAPSVALADDKTAFDLALGLGPILGPIAAGGVALVFGLLTCVTPCVFPMITITVSIFGAREAKSRRQAMLLSTCFVLGIVALFTPMFVGAALSGSLFGAALANKWVVLFLAAVFIALALSMFGLFEMTLPDSLQQRLSGVGGMGYGGAFLLGLVSSLIAAPCVGPVATSILLFIGKSRNVGLGAVFGAMYALGLGIPFWLVGTFAVSLPKGGKWMLWVKSFFGVVMIVMALYFLKAPFPALAAIAQPTTIFLAAMAAVVVAGVAIGAVHLDWHDGGTGTKVRKVLGIGTAVAGGFLFLAAMDKPREVMPTTAVDAQGAPVQLLSWGHSETEAVAKAKSEKRPMIVDFTAEWCGACKTLAKETLSDPRVMAKAGNFVGVKVDATNDEDPQVEAVKGKYKVVGLPTLVIYDSTGTERKRFTDFVPPEEFLAALEGVN
jgi:thiol:disulfide interchange protein DsbD